MAAGMLVPVVAFWKEWGILALVLLSFVLQVILLITAEIRRRKDSGVLKVIVWLAYLMADTTAIYVLGHMSVTSKTSQEYQLQAFWAPFLLLHLGGQDNITAYSIEDNRLWMRHLQSFVIQVLAAAYVLYESSIVARRTLLRQAAILMFVVGVLKYGERVCALKLACSDSNGLSGQNYQNLDNNHPLLTGKRLHRRQGKLSQEFRAHELLNWAKKLMKGPSFSGNVYSPPGIINYGWKEMSGVAEMQLSLMHDVFYSKCELIHTMHGYCIRVFSLSATIAALVLFCRFSEKDGYRRTDVAATYVLLAGAVVLEIISVLRAITSSWSYGRVIYENPCTDCCPALACLSFLSRQLAVVSAMCRGRVSARYWSGSIGQHNFTDMWNHCMDSRGSKIARWMGREDRWNMLIYTSSVPVSPDLCELLKKLIEASKYVDKEHPDHIQNSQGRAALKRKPGLYEALNWSLDNELDKSILIWHIGTHVYLSWYEAEHAGPPHHLAQVTKELSNYMMFLLAARPYMLSDNASRLGYVQLCYDVLEYGKYSWKPDLLKIMRVFGDGFGIRREPLKRREEVLMKNETFVSACRLGSQLIHIELETPDAKMLELISEVWVELLCYAAHRCTPDSHARQLSNGGEFTTIVALMLKYMENGLLGDEQIYMSWV